MVYRVWLVSGTTHDVRRRLPSICGVHGRPAGVRPQQVRRRSLSRWSRQGRVPANRRTPCGRPPVSAAGRPDHGAAAASASAAADGHRATRRAEEPPEHHRDAREERYGEERHNCPSAANVDPNPATIVAPIAISKRSDEPVLQLGTAAHPPRRPERAAHEHEVRRDRDQSEANGGQASRHRRRACPRGAR